VFGICEVIAGVMPNLALTAVALVPTGLAMLSLSTAANAHVQLGVTPTMRGRVMALYLICFMGGTPFGAPLIGWVAGVAGPRWGLIGGGAICLLSVAGLAIWLAHARGLHANDVRGLVIERLHVAA
jgi:hypothetical protein